MLIIKTQKDKKINQQQELLVKATLKYYGIQELTKTHPKNLSNTEHKIFEPILNYQFRSHQFSYALSSFKFQLLCTTCLRRNYA